MKKLGISILTAGLLSVNAALIPVAQNAWTLAGAPSDIDIVNIRNNNGCVQAIWQYDESNISQPWSLYHRDIESHSFGTISTLRKGSGFWVYADNTNCSISYDENTTTNSDDNSSNLNNDTNLSITLSDHDTLGWQDIGANTFKIFDSYQNNNNDNDWYDSITIGQSESSNYLTIDVYDKDNETWDSSQEYGTYRINSDINNTIMMNTGWSADVVLTGTQKITTLNGIEYSDLYITTVETHITASGDGESYIAYQGPRDVSNNNPLTSNSDLIEQYTTTNHPYTVNNHMLNENGDVVEISYENGIPTRTTTVVGSWTTGNENEVVVTLPENIITLSIVSDTNSTTGYSLQVSEQDVVGSVFNDFILSGSDASDDLIRAILQ